MAGWPFFGAVEALLFTGEVGFFTIGISISF
jgi:hypothetical protein